MSTLLTREESTKLIDNLREQGFDAKKRVCRLLEERRFVVEVNLNEKSEDMELADALSPTAYCIDKLEHKDRPGLSASGDKKWIDHVAIIRLCSS